MIERTLINTLDEIIYISDLHTHELLYANDYAKNLFIKQDYQGEKCYTMIHGETKPCSFCTNAYLKKDVFYTWEHTNTLLGRHFILKDTLIDWQGKPARLEIALDITQRENISQSIQKKLEIESALIECIRLLTTAKTLNEAMDTVLCRIGKFYNAQRAYILELDKTFTKGSNTYEWCAPGIPSQMKYLKKAPLSKLPFWQDAVKNKKNIVIFDIEQIKKSYPTEYICMKKQGIKNLMAAPFFMGKTNMGYIGIDNPAYQPNDPSLLQSLSHFVVNEIHKRRIQEELEYKSSHDALTKIYNRTRYLKYLEAAQQNTLMSIGIVFCDINGLKQLNDNYGHSYGDKMIIKTAQILQKSFCNSQVYRLSGDEFIVFCENIEQEQFKQMIDLAERTFQCEKSQSVSMGCLWKNEDIDLCQMVQQADELMYIKKQNYYKENSHKNSRRGYGALNKLLISIENQEFEMYLQPKFHLYTKQLAGAEALVRRHDKQRGTIRPDQFMSLLGKEKAIAHIDLFMFEQVCLILEKWQNEGVHLFPVSVNFSRITVMDSRLIQNLNQILNNFTFPKKYIEIELTENFGWLEYNTVIQVIYQLKQLEFLITLDDFGNKYSSISTISEIPIDRLKLDKSLIHKSMLNKKNHLLIQMLIEICEKLNITTIAEGIETQEQLELLKQLNCQMGQGYLLGRPMPVSEFQKLYMN